MVATRAKHEDRFEQAVQISIAGEARTFTTKGALFDALRRLEQLEITHNLKAAQAVFHLGQALLEAKAKLGYGHVNHLYAEVGIHRRRAQRAVAFAQALDDGRGGFDLDKYQAHKSTARNRHESGTRPCTFDDEGNPSVTAMMEAAGVSTTRAKTTKSDPRVTTGRAGTAESDARVATGDTAASGRPVSPADKIAQLREAAARSPGHQAFTATGPAGVPAHAEQLALDFDLDHTADTLARRAHDAAELQRGGRITTDQAARINAVLEHAGAAVEDIINTPGS